MKFVYYLYEFILLRIIIYKFVCRIYFFEKCDGLFCKINNNMRVSQSEELEELFI